MGSLPVLTKAPVFWRSLEELAGTVPRVDDLPDSSFPTRRSKCSMSPAAAISSGSWRPRWPWGARRLRLPARRIDRAVCAGSRGDRSGQAVVLRLGRSHRWLCLRRAGQEPHGTTDQSRRQPRPSGQPGRGRHLRPGHDSDALRPGPLAVGDPQRSGRHLGALADARPGPSRKAARQERGRPAHPDPDGRLADAGRSAAAVGRAVSRGEMA